MNTDKSVRREHRTLLLPDRLDGLGKLPPQALDLEEAVLGALMLEKSALAELTDFLKPEHFYSDAHRLIFEAILELEKVSSPVDMRTVTNQLRKSGKIEQIGGAHVIAELTSKVSSAANIVYHGRVIVEYALKRRLIEISSKIHRDAYEDTTDVFELMEKLEKDVFEVNQLEGAGAEYKNGVQLGVEFIKELQKRSLNKTGLTGVPSGFPKVDRITHGWQHGDLVIIAARPGMGKTAWVVTNVSFLVEQLNIPTAVFSMEMTSLQLTARLYSISTEIDAEKLKRGNLVDIEWDMLNKSKVSSPNLFIDDTPALRISTLRSKIRRMVARHKIKIAFVDYLQLMQLDVGEKTNREQEISKISRSLKQIAKECNIPIIALSQLSRGVETRGGDKRPQLSDLRDSGAIEQDADLVGFLYRPEYYKITVDEEGLPTAGISEFIIAKHRNGSLETIRQKFIGRFTKFAELDDMTKSNPSWGEDSANPFTPQSPDNSSDDMPF